MNKKKIKVTITGTAGQIGYASIFRIASGEMFGHDTELELCLLELERSVHKLEGICMELQDCGFPLLKNIQTTSDINKAMRGANWVILIGASPRKAGMERSDLIKVNGEIFSHQGRAINNNAADDVQVFVVANPCNTNALITMHNAPDIPRDRFFAMSLLDELRAKYQISNRGNIPIEQITNLGIWGNHSSTLYPDFFNAKINGTPLVEAFDDIDWLKNNFIPTVQKRGASVIKSRGASSAASAANSMIKSVYNLTHKTSTNDFFSVCKCSFGEYGIEENLIISLPCIYDNGLKVVEGIKHNSFALSCINNSIEELRKERSFVENLIQETV